MTTQNFIDMYGLLLGENAGPVKKMMMVHAAYWVSRYSEWGHTVNTFAQDHGFTTQEMMAALEIIKKEREKVL